jgi:hypothetical protein
MKPRSSYKRVLNAKNQAIKLQSLHSDAFIFTFDGPYINDKTPSAETKSLERTLLATFRLFGD